MVKFRHEWKHEISYGDLLTIRQRLGAIARVDCYAKNGTYEIRSLYFDTPGDKALREKLDGVSRREKFRMRYYNGDPSLIRLEKKCKIGGLGNKQSVPLSEEEARNIVDGEIDWMLSSGRPLLQELYSKMKTQQLRPKTIVDYTREPFVYAPGNVRITLDYGIRTGIGCTDFLNPNCPMISAGEPPIILEVKWDAFLPDVIRDAIQLGTCRTAAFSKYAQCRIYG
jgi:hypothetical protein